MRLHHARALILLGPTHDVRRNSKLSFPKRLFDATDLHSVGYDIDRLCEGYGYPDSINPRNGRTV